MYTELDARSRGDHGESAADSSGNHVQELFDGVDDLIKRMADSENPEIRKIRAKVRVTLLAARSAVENAVHQARHRAAPVAAGAAALERENPWHAAGLGLLVALGINVVISRWQ